MENEGLTQATAIEVDSGRDINNVVSIYLDRTYGQGDDEYFVLSDQFIDDPKTKTRYKVLNVEIPNKPDTQLWFKIV